MKKLMSLALVFALVLGMVPAAFAAQLPFTDVEPGRWYTEAVEYVYTNGLMNGTGNNLFSPDSNMSRGMIVTVLHRLEGSPASSVQIPFDDVPGGKYYSAAVAWSYENGIVNGISETQFAPDANVTREQLVTIFYRYANAKGYSTTGMDDLSNSKLGYFTDIDKMHNYARNAMVWAEVNGIINGVTENTLVPDGNATRAQFATIMKRFADWQENRNAPATPLTAQKDAQLRADLQEDIDAILYSETEIVHSDTFIPGETYTGTAYYFSNDGDDFNNDGLSPESPWQSMGKLLALLDARDDAILRPGDAIFLRRGDTFRLPNWALDVSVDDITVSAYGEGDKPIITASSENGSGKDKWKLVYEDATGKKIWQFYKDVRDTSMLIFNDGEAFAKRIYEFYDGANYISCEDTYWWMHDDKGVTLLDRLLPLEESLTEDMTIISRAKSPDTVWGDVERGPLYLRCDKGNPGALYDSIEFTELEVCGLFYMLADSIVVDNISLRCNGSSFTKVNPYTDYVVIQNCEFAYGGGCVWEYLEGDSDSHFVVAQGDGIYCAVQNVTVRNNYFHDCMCCTATFEPSWEGENCKGYYHVLDNVMVNTYGVGFNSEEQLRYLDSMIIRGNQIWNTGRFDNGKIIYSGGSLGIVGNSYDEYIVENNVFYGTEISHESNALLHVTIYSPREDMRNPNDTYPVIRNNTYVQYAGRKFGYFDMWWNEPDNKTDMDVFIDDPDLKTKVAEITGDTTSEFYVIE